MNSQAFFTSLRSRLGSLTQSQVDGINVLLAAQPGLPLTFRAYCLGTVWHETDKAMKPVYEEGGRSYFDKYEPGTPLGRGMLGNTLVGDGYRFRGRGYVQLTGRRNYVHASNVLGCDLVGNPDLALDPTIAAQILYTGCRDGWFTGKKLADYIQSPGRTDYLNARRIVNGTDHAALIAEYALTFERALREGGYEATDAIPVTPGYHPPFPAPSMPPDVEPPHAPPQGVLALFLNMITGMFHQPKEK